MKKKIAALVSSVGLLLAGVSLFADQIGLGDVDPDHFIIGTKQIAGIIAGLLIFLTGIFIFCKKNK